MKEYIEKAAVLNLLAKINPVVYGSMFDYQAHSAVSECLREARYGIESIPAADVAEVRHGRWIFEPGKIPYCSECKEYSDDGDKGATFCPWCCARMDKEDDHEAI